ncbi:MAG: hypothetical protein ACTSUE_26355 [Promethearchaeota archaeon]
METKLGRFVPAPPSEVVTKEEHRTFKKQKLAQKVTKEKQRRKHLQKVEDQNMTQLEKILKMDLSFYRKREQKETNAERLAKELQNRERFGEDEYYHETFGFDSEDSDVEPDHASIEVPKELEKIKMRKNNVAVRAIRMIYNTQHESLAVTPQKEYGHWGFGDFLFQIESLTQKIPDFHYKVTCDIVSKADTALKEVDDREHDILQSGVDRYTELNCECVFKVVVEETVPDPGDGFKRTDTFYVLFNPKRASKDFVEFWKDFEKMWKDQFYKDTEIMDEFLTENDPEFNEKWEKEKVFDEAVKAKVKKEGGKPYKNSLKRRRTHLVHNHMACLSKMHLVYVYSTPFTPCENYVDLIQSYVPNLHMFPLSLIVKNERTAKRHINTLRQKYFDQRQQQVSSSSTSKPPTRPRRSRSNTIVS